MFQLILKEEVLTIEVNTFTLLSIKLLLYSLNTVLQFYNNKNFKSLHNLADFINIKRKKNIQV